jgi:nucleoside-diphosphate-sugar epimerase
MQALVTGATGFLGTSLVRYLLASGTSVRVLARSAAKAAPLVAALVTRQHTFSGAEPESTALLERVLTLLTRSREVEHWSWKDPKQVAKIVASCCVAEEWADAKYHFQAAQQGAVRVVNCVRVSVTLGEW